MASMLNQSYLRTCRDKSMYVPAITLLASQLSPSKKRKNLSVEELQIGINSNKTIELEPRAGCPMLPLTYSITISTISQFRDTEHRDLDLDILRYTGSVRTFLMLQWWSTGSSVWHIKNKPPSLRHTSQATIFQKDVSVFNTGFIFHQTHSNRAKVT